MRCFGVRAAQNVIGFRVKFIEQGDEPCSRCFGRGVSNTRRLGRNELFVVAVDGTGSGKRTQLFRAGEVKSEQRSLVLQIDGS